MLSYTFQAGFKMTQYKNPLPIKVFKTIDYFCQNWIIFATSIFEQEKSSRYVADQLIILHVNEDALS